MKRFRFTLLAVCLLLLWLGGTDLLTLFRNSEPLTISLAELEGSEPPRDWLHLTGGYQDLEEAISTSGSVELEAFLVPLKSAPDRADFRVLVETRNPRVMELLRTYYFQLDSEAAQRQFQDQHRDEFFGPRDVTGMVVTGLVASGNRDKLMKLAQDTGLQVPENVIFLSEGKEPARWRGFIFVALALAGLVRFATLWRQPSV